MNRKAPPTGFPELPELPDLPSGRYTDSRCFALEQQYIWRKSWLLDSHIDAAPVPGAWTCRAGLPAALQSFACSSTPVISMMRMARAGTGTRSIPAAARESPINQSFPKFRFGAMCRKSSGIACVRHRRSNWPAQHLSPWSERASTQNRYG